jgi:hypothetical protein
MQSLCGHGPIIETSWFLVTDKFPQVSLTLTKIMSFGVIKPEFDAANLLANRPFWTKYKKKKKKNYF